MELIQIGGSFVFVFLHFVKLEFAENQLDWSGRVIVNPLCFRGNKRCLIEIVFLSTAFFLIKLLLTYFYFCC